MKKLWILKPVSGLPETDNPWEPEYDKAHGFVVWSETEEQARELAHEDAGDENNGWTANTRRPWLDPKYSTCKELAPEGPPHIVMKDFYAG